jgi:hypothetical protein
MAALFGSTPLASAQASSPATTHSNAPTGSTPLPIFYDRALSAQGFPNPLVKVRIAGHEATFIVDSGASTNVLANWYVKLLGIPARATDSRAVGSDGKTATERFVHGIQGHWSDSQRFTLNEAVAIAFPPYFQSLHIGGAVSPQLLAPAGMAAVLDLRIPSLRFVPLARALSDLRRSNAGAPSLDLGQSCRNLKSKLVNRVYLTPVTAAGVSDLMLVDTGATKTTFSDKSKIAHAVERGSKPDPGHSSEGVGGKVGGDRVVRNVQLSRGGRIVTLSPSIGEVSSPCGARGILGMDALRSCVLVLGDKKMAFSCG